MRWGSSGGCQSGGATTTRARLPARRARAGEESVVASWLAAVVSGAVAVAGAAAGAALLGLVLVAGGAPCCWTWSRDRATAEDSAGSCDKAIKGDWDVAGDCVTAGVDWESAGVAGVAPLRAATITTSPRSARGEPVELRWGKYMRSSTARMGSVAEAAAPAVVLVKAVLVAVRVLSVFSTTVFAAAACAGAVVAIVGVLDALAVASVSVREDTHRSTTLRSRSTLTHASPSCSPTSEAARRTAVGGAGASGRCVTAGSVVVHDAGGEDADGEAGDADALAAAAEALRCLAASDAVQRLAGAGAAAAVSLLLATEVEAAVEATLEFVVAASSVAVSLAATRPLRAPLRSRLLDKAGFFAFDAVATCGGADTG